MINMAAATISLSGVGLVAALLGGSNRNVAMSLGGQEILAPQRLLKRSPYMS
jgi:hypothetical protein